MNTYLEKLKSPLWQKKRLEIFTRDDWQCQSCGDKETNLHVHHILYRENPWSSHNDELVTLCLDCHQVEEFCKKAQVSGFYFLKTNIKKVCSDRVIVCSTDSEGVRFFSVNGSTISVLAIGSELFSRVMHQMMDIWLFTGKSEYLKDPTK